MDTVYRPDDNAEPAPTEPVVVQQENLDAFRDEQRRRGLEVDPRLPEPAPMTPREIGDAQSGRSSDAVLALQMGEELRQLREQRGHDWEDKKPIVEVRARAESFKDVGAATRERTDTRQLAEKNALLAAGVNEHVADALAARHKDRLVELGIDGKLADELIDNPPTAVPMATDRGEPIDPETTFDNVWSATKAVRNGRAAAEAALQQQLAQWQPTEQAPPEAEVVHTEPAPQQQGPTPEQQQQAEALAAENFRLMHERAALNMTAEERALVARDQSAAVLQAGSAGTISISEMT